MPSLDTARNLKAMFEEKAQEAAKPQVKERGKVNRFVVSAVCQNIKVAFRCVP